MVERCFYELTPGRSHCRFSGNSFTGDVESLPHQHPALATNAAIALYTHNSARQIQEMAVPWMGLNANDFPLQYDLLVRKNRS